MSESGIYIRVGKNNVLLEDLYPIERIEWLNGLEKEGLIKTVNLLCDVIEDFKVNYQNSILENQKLKADYGTKVQIERDMLQQENKELKDKLKTYEDPEDLTLMFMYCDEKAKDKIKELEEENFNLRENIYIEKMSFSSEGRNIKELIEMPTYEDLLNQQKEFMNYINAYIELLKDKPDLVEEGQKDILEEVLSKYKSIIGGKDE